MIDSADMDMMWRIKIRNEILVQRWKKVLPAGPWQPVCLLDSAGIEMTQRG